MRGSLRRLGLGLGAACSAAVVLVVAGAGPAIGEDTRLAAARRACESYGTDATKLEGADSHTNATRSRLRCSATETRYVESGAASWNSLEIGISWINLDPHDSLQKPNDGHGRDIGDPMDDGGDVVIGNSGISYSKGLR